MKNENAPIDRMVITLTGKRAQLLMELSGLLPDESYPDLVYEGLLYVHEKYTLPEGHHLGEMGPDGRFTRLIHSRFE